MFRLCSRHIFWHASDLARGDTRLLNWQCACLTAAVSARAHVLRTPVEPVHAMMDQELDVIEFILRAFVVRRSMLFGDDPVAGQRYSPRARETAHNHQY